MPGLRKVGHWSVVTNSEHGRGKRTYVMYDDSLYAIVYGIYVQRFQRVSVLPSSNNFLHETGRGRSSERGFDLHRGWSTHLFPIICDAGTSYVPKTKTETHLSNHALRRHTPGLWYTLRLFTHHVSLSINTLPVKQGRKYSPHTTSSCGNASCSTLVTVAGVESGHKTHGRRKSIPVFFMNEGHHASRVLVRCKTRAKIAECQPSVSNPDIW